MVQGYNIDSDPLAFPGTVKSRKVSIFQTKNKSTDQSIDVPTRQAQSYFELQFIRNLVYDEGKQN